MSMEEQIADLNRRGMSVAESEVGKSFREWRLTGIDDVWVVSTKDDKEACVDLLYKTVTPSHA